jgi:DNA polymerase-3 subunit alpha
MVAYVLGITELDPMKHGLLFERFLNPERISMPDIDMDFDERRRGDMIRYATEKYGEERVAQIITTARSRRSRRSRTRPGSWATRSRRRRSPRRCRPPVMGKDVPLSGIFDTTHPATASGGVPALYESTPTRSPSSTPQGARGASSGSGAFTRPA